MKRKALLSEEDIALWAEVAGRIRPLPGRIVPKGPIRSAPTLAAKPRTAPPLQVTPATEPSSLKPLVPLERRLKQKLRRGQREIDGVLDLHGMRQDEAHRALLAFLMARHALGASVVLIITGKGYSGAPDPERERGVLKRMLPHWLSDPGLRGIVLGFENAAENHGGSGAFYIRLRRRH